MMKTTQFLTNIKFWQSSLVALLFLFSFTVNSQSVGDDLMAASNGALSTLNDDAVNGVNGQGSGCVPCGWSGAAGVNYAPTTAGHGPVHSGDRMWKTFAGNGGNGEFVNQVFTDIAAGTYTLTFYHRWTNAGNLDYSAGPGPQVTFKQSDGNGGWLDGYAAEVPQGNIGANAEWTANVHTIEVAEAGTYRMQVYKNGGTGANPNPMNGCLHLDTFSLVYDAAPAEPGCDLTIAMTDSYGDSWNGGQLVVSVNGVEQGVYANVDADGSSPNSGGETQTVALSVSYGDEVAFDFTCGSWCYENSFVVTDADGNTVASGGGADDADATFACADEPKLALQGIMDGDLGGSDGKALHLVATGTISDLSAYGVGVDNNGQGSDGQEYTFDAISVEAGAHILLARNPDVMTAYLAAPGVAFDHVIEASSSISQNGDDAISLYYNGALVEQYGDPDVDGTGEAWEYTDSWAYKVDGAWTNGELDCMGGDTSCTSSCPYPFIADACPIIADCVVSVEYVPGSFAYENTFSITSGDNVLVSGSGSDGAQSFEFGLSYGENYTISLVDSYGDGWNGGVLVVDGTSYTITDDGVTDDGYVASFEGSCASPMHDVTFNVDARNIIVHDRGMYMGGGVLGGSDAVAMSDEDGDGIWSVTLSLEEGTTGNWAFFNSPGDGGDWGTKENLEGQACADAANFNDRVVPAFDADNLEFNFCFAVCNDTNSFCAEQAVRHDVTFTVGTADIEVGANGMFIGGGLMGGSNGHAMADNGDDTHSVTISVPEGTAGNYAFFNSPNNHYDWGTKENLEGQDCADTDNFNDRYLDAVTEAGSVSFCFGTCDAECVVEEPCEFSIVLTDLYGDGWNGNSLDVLVNGEVVLDDIATQSEDDTNPVTFAFSVVTGDVIDVVYDDSGTWDGENSYVVYNNQGEEIAAESGAGGGSSDPGPADTIGLAAICAEPQNFVTADPNYEWGGYMVVFDVDGNYMFESGWAVADLQTTLNPDVPNIILEPNFNTYNAEDPYWSNGEIGNKIMLATTQVESDNLYNGVGLTFSGSVAEHTLGEDYEAVYFIKCLDQSAGWIDMLNAEYEIPLPESGEFSVSVSGDLLPEGKLVQFGFYIRGLNANPALDYGKVVIGDIGLSIGENDSLDMVIYPNPVNGDYVTIQTPLNGDKLVEVFDINGRKVMERLLTTDTLNVGSISAGMYIVKVTVEGQSNVSKLIVE
jgi:hypothetical protein